MIVRKIIITSPTTLNKGVKVGKEDKINMALKLNEKNLHRQPRVSSTP